jgi:GTP-binding protein Era
MSKSKSKSAAGTGSKPKAQSKPKLKAKAGARTKAAAPPKVEKVEHRSGYAAIVGRPNVGKSTLLNALMGRKLSIVTPKPQTTRHRILGILTQPDAQIMFVDTPGIHGAQRRVMNQYMNRSALSSLDDADVLLFMVEALVWTDEDARVLERVKRSGRPALALVNKVDRVRDKPMLLPFIEALAGRMEFTEIIPVSAERRDNLDKLPELIRALLPAGPALFPADQITDRNERFLAAEIIREKLTWRLRDELPYGLTVEIETFDRLEDEGKQRIGIRAVIWVERPGQKAIVIGRGGERLKEIGRLARLELNELLFGTEKGSVHLELWVKVKENWSDNEMALRQLGYET